MDKVKAEKKKIWLLPKPVAIILIIILGLFALVWLFGILSAIFTFFLGLGVALQERPVGLFGEIMGMVFGILLFGCIFYFGFKYLIRCIREKR